LNMRPKKLPLIVMALPSEGGNHLEKLGAEVLYCGVGKVNAAYTLTRRLQRERVSHVLNFGSAGSHRFTKGSLIAADQFVQRDMDVRGLGFAMGETPFDYTDHIIKFPRVFEHLPHGVCGSGDSFLQGICPMSSDIIDMEAYALAKVCTLESVTFACVKYITDDANAKASDDWQTNVTQAGQAFEELFKSVF